MRDMERQFSLPLTHRLHFTRDVLNPRQPLLARTLSMDRAARGVMAFIDDGLLGPRPDLPHQVRRYFAGCECQVPTLRDVRTVPGGEACKNDPATLDRILRRVAEAGMDRRSYVLAIGGGAVLDVVGYAAAIVHRGLRLVRLPTTSLAQADAAVGVKNGVNAFGRKNFLGTFAVPWAVICDTRFLQTLSDRDWRCGLAEAVKVALIRDADLFERIEHDRSALARRDAPAAEAIIQRSAALHLDHITTGGDPFETDIARPLDLGHWSAHQLEQMTDFALRHGEAVAIGLAIDVNYAALTGWMSDAQAARVRNLLRGLGFTLAHPALERVKDILQGLEAFREHLGGPLTLTLPRGIGEQVNIQSIDRDRLARAITQLHAPPPPAVPTGRGHPPTAARSETTSHAKGA